MSLTRTEKGGPPSWRTCFSLTSHSFLSKLPKQVIHIPLDSQESRKTLVHCWSPTDDGDIISELGKRDDPSSLMASGPVKDRIKSKRVTRKPAWCVDYEMGLELDS